MKRKLVIILTSLALFLTLTTSPIVYADFENVNVGIFPPAVSEESDTGITPQFTFPPTNVVNLATNGTMNFQGSATGSTLFLNNAFTGVTKIFIWCENFHPSSTLTMTLHKMNLIGTTTIGTYKLEVGTGGGTFVGGLDSSAKYYLSFSAPSNFSGYVEQN
jgi:hypothetical protein